MILWVSVYNVTFSAGAIQSALAINMTGVVLAGSRTLDTMQLGTSLYSDYPAAVAT